MDWEIVSILIGVLGAVSGVFFKQAFNRASEQKIIALKLSVYLKDHEYDLKKNSGLSNLFQVITDQFATSNSKTISKNQRINVEELLNNVNLKIDYLEKLLDSPDSQISQDLSPGFLELYSDIKTQSDLKFQHEIQKYKNYYNDLKSNITFISDNEAAILSEDILHLVLLFRSRLELLMEKFISNTLMLRELEEYEFEKVYKATIELVKEFIYIMEFLLPLKNGVQKLINKNKLLLILKNLIS